MRTITFTVPFLFLLSSCSTPSAKYADELVGYAVTKGKVRRVANLNSEDPVHLADGLAMSVSEGHCQVAIQLGERVKTIALLPKSILVLGAENDYILVPHWPPGEEPEAVPDPKPKSSGKESLGKAEVRQ